MARVYAIDGLVPVITPGSFVHPDAVLIGDVIVGEGCYIGPGASLRGDFGSIIVGDGANIQDNCVLHSFPQKELAVGPNGHIAHGAVLHGCTIGEGALIGINAVIMDDAIIGAQALVGGASFVKAGMEVPAAHLCTGVPARVIRPLSDKELAWVSNGPLEYQQLAQRCLASLVPAEPLTAPERDRQRYVPSAAESKPLHQLKKQS